MKKMISYIFSEYQTYKDMLALQHTLHTLRAEEQIDDTILLLEHHPVISVGRSRGAASHLLADPVALRKQGIEVCMTNRGGDITYHGPGQLVVYLIIALQERDIREFIYHLEQSVIHLLACYDIEGERKAGYPGVWVGEEKICALGVYVRKWVTMHGIALNISTNLSHFNFIVPCGIHEKGVTSLQKIYQHRQDTYHLDMEPIKQEYLTCFAETFQADICQHDQQHLRRLTEVMNV